MFSLVIYELGKDILISFSLIMILIIKMIVMIVVIIYVQSWAHTSYPPTPHLGAFMMMINKNNCSVIGAIITMLP